MFLGLQRDDMLALRVDGLRLRLGCETTETSIMLIAMAIAMMNERMRLAELALLALRILSSLCFAVSPLVNASLEKFQRI